MNTRGLMELVVLNIGYDLGILSPGIFAIMVLMALTTTFMTDPLLDLINYNSKKSEVLV
jgi:Kef-type K+ transport system membrane component KefB